MAFQIAQSIGSERKAASISSRPNEGPLSSKSRRDLIQKHQSDQ
jgi:hypothetical protein